MTLQEALRRERERCATRGRIAQLENKVVDIEIRSLPPTAEDGVVVPLATLQHWLEYWNGSQNERAMSDALSYLMAEFEQVISATQPVAEQAQREDQRGPKGSATSADLSDAEAVTAKADPHQQAPTGAQEAAGQVELVRLDATQTWNADSKLVAFFGGEAAKRVAECSADGVWTVHDEAEFKRLNPAFHALWKQNERQAAEIERLRQYEIMLNWLGNRVLACDYGDNDRAGAIGWRIRHDLLRGPNGERQPAFMYGKSFGEAIRAELEGE